MRNTAIISVDGHVKASRRQYREYIPQQFLETYDEQVKAAEEAGTRDAGNLHPEFVPEVQWDSDLRLAKLESVGVVAEVLFPNGRPFQLNRLDDFATSANVELAEVGRQAYNRWLVDFCSTAPHRLGGLAVTSFADVEATVKEIHWAKANGLVGIVLPAFSENKPLFHKDFDPVWSVLEETQLPAATHTAISSITDHLSAATLQAVPHPAVAAPIMTAQAFFFTQQILGHALWGGVLERHPGLHLVLTEQGSGWVIGALRGWDYSWTKSYLRRDVREIVKEKPSFYYERQIHLGSSILSRAEAKAREQIGAHKMLIGSDYPHHEGTWGAGPGTTEYLQATLGATHVPAEDARKMLGQNAIETFHLDGDALRETADEVGNPLAILLQEPTQEWFPRGDVHKPLLSAW